MIAICSLRVRKLLEEKGMESATDIPKSNFGHTIGYFDKLSNIMTQTFVPVVKNDSFVYDLAQYFDVSADYLLGLSEDRDFFVKAIGNDPKFKMTEIARLVGKYCKQENIDMINTNILANKTAIDRDVFDFIFDNNDGSSWWITTSYYITTRLSKTFDFDWYTVMSFLLQAEDEDNEGKELLRKLVDKYNKEFDANVIVAE